MNTEANLTQREPQTPVKQAKPQAVAPPVDVYENREEFLLIADLPGTSKDDLRIHLDKGQLTLEARRNDPVVGRTLASEIRAVEYRRAFSIPQGIDADRVSADLQGGVLSIHLPKSAAVKPRQIQVRAG
jgi:HSP20 family molecular chaperone IbpA